MKEENEVIPETREQLIIHAIKEMGVFRTNLPNNEVSALVAKAIEALEQQPKWIPVSERLPEENGYYLTTTMYHEVYCDYWEEERFNRTEAIIAWMPLPEPYREDGE